MSSWYTVKENGILISCHIQPCAKRNEIIGEYGNSLKIKIASPPVDGAANEKLCDFLADLFSVKKKDVAIIRGQTSRSKAVFVFGITETFLKDKIKV